MAAQCLRYTVAAKVAKISCNDSAHCTLYRWVDRMIMRKSTL